MKLCGFVYILTIKRNGTLYVGVTRDIAARLEEHRSNANPRSFVSQYGLYTLVWYERHELLVDAIAREKRIKRWKRDWKLSLIEEQNPQWRNIELDYTDTR